MVVVAAMALVGCGEVWPLNERADGPLGEAEAAEIARDFIGLGLGDDRVWSDDIHWYEGPCLIPNEGDCPSGALVQRGWPESGYIMSIVTRPRISDSSVVHEITHWYLAESGFGIDLDHASHVWPRVSEANDELRRMGL